MTEVTIDGQHLAPSQVVAVARGARCRLDPEAARRMAASAALQPDGILQQKWSQLVGGPMPEQSELAVRTFVEGHCAGLGGPMRTGDVRALMVARANVLAVGHSGVRPRAAEALIDALNRDRIPQVPRHGAVGVGGSVPLAHVLRALCGYGGQVDTPDGTLPANEAFPDPLVPTQKEALALLNGSTLTTALAALAVERARVLVQAAISACALSFEVVRADTNCLEEPPLRARNHRGAVRAARKLRNLLRGSTLATHQRNPDSFSIRCAPASIGAVLDTVDYVEAVVTRELNGAVDNPLVFPDTGEVFEGGNFHGAPLALVMDHLKAAVTQLGSMSERRLFRLTYGQLSGLPSFLVHGTGKNSGLMLAQYTAASLVSECKGLAHPASVDSIPTIQHHEDHVSMGPQAARGALHILELLFDVVAVELLCGAQGLDFHLAEGVRCGEGSQQVYERVRERVPTWQQDRVLHTDLQKLGQAVRAGVFSTPPVPPPRPASQI